MCQVYDYPILLFEAGPRILAAFPEDLAVRARRRLEQLGVRDGLLCRDVAGG